MDKKDFIIAYALAAVTGSTSARAALKSEDLVDDAVDLWNTINKAIAEESEAVVAQREKRSPRRPTPSAVEL